MGKLVLPPSGSIYIDTNTIIYRVDSVQPYLDAALPLWEALDAGVQAVVTSELTLLEVLVRPFQQGNKVLQQLYEGILYGTPGLTCAPVTRQTLETAAQLRATTSLKTPDAIHAATALLAQCALFVTNDTGFRRVPGLNVAILSAVAAS